MRKDELIRKATEILEDNDSLFIEAVEELDSWNGFADGFRCYEMYMIDELFCDCKVSDFLDKLTSSFDHTDSYFVDTIYGLDSTNDPIEIYKDNVTTGELIDNLIDNYNHIDISDYELSEILETLANGNFDDEEAQDFTWTDEQ